MRTKGFVAIAFALLAFCQAAQAQDRISTFDGKEIEARVLEVGPEELVYRKWSNPDGPRYRMPLSEVREIRYENGEVETYGAQEDSGGGVGVVRRLRGHVGDYGTDLSYYYEYPSGPMYREGAGLYIKGAHVQAGAVLDRDLYERWRSASNMRFAGIALWVFGASGVCGGLSLDRVHGGDGTPMLVTGGIMILVGVPLHVLANNRLDDITWEQNSRRELGESFSPSISFGAQRHGFGLALNF